MNQRQTYFMPAVLEREIATVCTALGFNITPSAGKSPNRKEIELNIGLGSQSDCIYISRSVGLSSGELQVVISSELFARKGNVLVNLDGVRRTENRQTKQQILQSSNYLGFRNKGSEGKGEHWGYGYRILASDGLTSLATFLRHAKPTGTPAATE